MLKTINIILNIADLVNLRETPRRNQAKWSFEQPFVFNQYSQSEVYL